ncbi:MAG: hypothetical protein AVDCRST_MAG89-4804, partial [uncultured Gemmatimonadetes bacterium]
ASDYHLRAPPLRRRLLAGRSGRGASRGCTTRGHHANCGEPAAARDPGRGHARPHHLDCAAGGRARPLGGGAVPGPHQRPRHLGGHLEGRLRTRHRLRQGKRARAARAADGAPWPARSKQARRHHLRRPAAGARRRRAPRGRPGGVPPRSGDPRAGPLRGAL